MADEHGRTADSARPTRYCTRAPMPGEHLGAACGQCGHAVLLHIGVRHCPVCELVDLNERASATIGRAVDDVVRRTLRAQARAYLPPRT